MKLFAARECVFYYFILIKLSVDNQKIMNAIMNCNISNIDNCFVLICCPISNLDFFSCFWAEAAAEVHEAVEHEHHGNQNLRGNH